MAEFVKNIKFDLFTVNVLLGDSATLTSSKAYTDENIITLQEVDEHLGIDSVNGRADYVLNEKGEMVKLPEADLTNYYTKDETPEAIDTHLTINRNDGDENKVLTEKGTFKALAQTSIGVTGSELYASTAASDLAGFKSLVTTIQPTETEITLTANSASGIVWGDEYISAQFPEALTIPSKSWGFDYWRKVSTSVGVSSKHLRISIYRAGNRIPIFTLQSPDINETEFTERQISYVIPEIALQAGDRLIFQEGFSTTHGANVTLTYIVGDGRGWFMRLPLPMEHSALVNKNSEADFQHVNQAEKDAIASIGDILTILNSI